MINTSQNKKADMRPFVAYISDYISSKFWDGAEDIRTGLIEHIALLDRVQMGRD